MRGLRRDDDQGSLHRKLCDECGPRHLAEYRERRKAQVRKGLRVSHCIDCRVEVVNTGPGPLGKRCPEHKAQAQRDASRRYEQRRAQFPVEDGGTA